MNTCVAVKTNAAKRHELTRAHSQDVWKFHFCLEIPNNFSATYLPYAWKPLRPERLLQRLLRSQPARRPRLSQDVFLVLHAPVVHSFQPLADDHVGPSVLAS